MNVPIEISSGADLNTYDTPGMYYCPSDATVVTILNCPLPHGFALFVENLTREGSETYVFQTIKFWRDGFAHATVAYVRCSYPRWGEWVRIATAEPPQEYSLPLASGWSGSATYFKTQDCVCTLNVTLKKGEAIGSGTFIVATMPVSFRPAIAASCCAINEKGGYITTTASHFAVHKTGEVAIQMNDPMAVGFRASLTYKAVD